VRQAGLTDKTKAIGIMQQVVFVVALRELSLNVVALVVACSVDCCVFLAIMKSNYCL
jgi:hypothetical protein